MADKLKGITVEISGETTGLTNALRDVNQESRSIQGELSEVQKLLKFNPDNAELLAQRQTLLNRQIENTSEKLNRLKSVQNQVQDQFDRGDLGEEEYRRFQREIIATEGRLEHFQRQAQETGDKAKLSFKDMGSGIASGIAGAVAGAGIGEVISKSMETAHLETQIKVGFDVPEDAVGKIKEIITGIQAYGIEGETALEGVRKQFALNADLSVAENEKIIKSAAVISSTYNEIDFNELIQESNEFGEAIGISQQEALAMTNALLKVGFPPDQLDVMSEYGSQLKRAGYNAEEIQGIFRAGVETKSWNIDVLLDGVKEGRIRLAEFGQGVDKTTAGLIKGTKISSEQLQVWGEAIAEGGDAGKVAFGEVATQLGKVQDSTQRNAIGTRLFGTLWEEQGKKITDALAGANSKTGDLKRNQELLNEAIKNQDNDPQVRLNAALTLMLNKLTPLLIKIAELVGKLADWAAKNPEIAATITAVMVAIGIITGVIIALLPVIALLTAENIALAASLIPITLPVLAIIAAFAALIAIGVLVYKNWGKIKAEASKAWGEIKAIITGVSKKIVAAWKKDTADFKKAWDWIVKGLSNIGKNIKKEWDKAIGDIKGAWNKAVSWFKGINLRTIGSDIVGGLIKGMNDMYQKVKTKAHEIATTVKQAIKDKLKMRSPSKVMYELGRDAGQGLVNGLNDTIQKVTEVTTKISQNIASSVTSVSDHGALKKYFDAIREDGDWMNDWLTHLPKKMRASVMAMGKSLAPELKGTKITKDSVFKKGNTITVNLNSPKALDVREANKVFNRTMTKMSANW